MPALDILSFDIPGLDAVLSAAASLLNSAYLPAATTGSVALALAGIPVVAALVWLAGRFTNRSVLESRFAERINELSVRLHGTELQLADAASETLQLRQRVEQLNARQETLSAGNARGSLRQAIALSRHGATTRQLIETCGLSQGEAHLVQTLYGRAAGNGQPEELH